MFTANPFLKTPTEASFEGFSLPESNPSSFADNDSSLPEDQFTNYCARGDVGINHPRLNNLRQAARRIAEVEHATKGPSRRTRNGYVSKVKTRRQASNKRSAEICRESKTIYIGLLEDEVGKDELQLEDLKIQRLEMLRVVNKLKEDVKKLEEKKRVAVPKKARVEPNDSTPVHLIDAIFNEPNMECVMDEMCSGFHDETMSTWSTMSAISTVTEEEGEKRLNKRRRQNGDGLWKKKQKCARWSGLVDGTAEMGWANGIKEVSCMFDRIIEEA